MNNKKIELAAIPERERHRALEKFRAIRPFLEFAVPLPVVSSQSNIPLRTLRRWVQRYKTGGLVALARRTEHTTKEESAMHKLIEALVLESPHRTIANIKRTLDTVAQQQNWPKTSYSSVYRIIKRMDRKLMMLAHEGSKAYSEKFDIVYRRESSRPNQIWQADHSVLDCWILNAKDQPARPWLTVILDDFSRAVCGYLLGFEAPCSANTALALHQAIWRKSDPHWRVFGIPSAFYSDHGSDFTSKHMEQVAADLKMQLIFSMPGKPRGRGKIERFFRTVDETFLGGMPGYRNKAGAKMNLHVFSQMFHEWMLTQYMKQNHSEIGCPPNERWEQDGFLPQMAVSLEQLDLLLLMVPKARRVHQDGIHFQCLRYMDPTLAAYVGEHVIIRFDPRDLAEIRVFYDEKFLCRAVCTEIESSSTSLKEIVRARNQRRRELKAIVTDRAVIVTDYITAHVNSDVDRPEPAADDASREPKLRRYIND